MRRIGWIFYFPILILSVQPCTNIDHLKIDESEVLFTGRILSLHQWSTDYPYSAFVWVFRILRGTSVLLAHYQTRELERPLYIIIDNLTICEQLSALTYYDMKIFGVRINNARFQSLFRPLPVTLTNMKAIEGKMSYLIYSDNFCLRDFCLAKKD
ncbi:unnamed protein product [Adineta ricciae]|uniref:NtA domain-containing protein n=1 Tax=Adineta ricciae TaxID=249248 RepID=A0A813PF87_ADIRI|nr:unnamed protein product [Adineta ricciae]